MPSADVGRARRIPVPDSLQRSNLSQRSPPRWRAHVRAARSVLAVLAALAADPDGAQAQTSADEAQVKAAFVYNFLKFVEWPLSAFASPTDSLIVAIVGNGPMADAAARFLEGKPVNDRAVAVRRVRDDGALHGVHVLLVGTADPDRARRLLDSIDKSGVLSIGEAPDFAIKGGIIGLLVEAQKVRFEINPDAATAAHLKISSKLLALAKIVRPRKPQDRP